MVTDESMQGRLYILKESKPDFSHRTTERRGLRLITQGTIRFSFSFSEESIKLWAAEMERIRRSRSGLLPLRTTMIMTPGGQITGQMSSFRPTWPPETTSSITSSTSSTNVTSYDFFVLP